MKDLVFVYGTLKKGKRLHHYLEKSYFFGEGYIEGYEMYMVDWYPAVVKGKGKVYGEVYAVDQKTLNVLDKIEDEGRLYKRIKENVKMGDKIVNCWVYLYQKSTKNLKKIDTGRF
ncbi:gamma-glutamylcyclotransferase family protein [Persephonella sp.]|uniref:gamma-glutamylcyclotransferase family protein n=1 Tax=Persephonella sp. TaxID=2060922 RepID=UPI0025E91E48|nr:gamma-glutamylcyclotransferase family protein [Persephonella sp.]